MLFFTPNNAKLRIRNSPIHGKGLFAQDFIAKDEILGTIQGIRTNKDDSYTLWITEDYPVRMLCKFKYINHSDSPNVVLYDTLYVIFTQVMKLLITMRVVTGKRKKSTNTFLKMMNSQN